MKVARFASELRFEDLPAAVVARAVEALADYCAVAVASAAGGGPLEALLAVARAQSGVTATNGRSISGAGGAAGASVIGRADRLAPMWAAICNGGSAHHLELDDGHTRAHCHPGVTVLPALLAQAEVDDSTGADLIAAIVVGYETAIRIGRAVSPNAQYQRGFHIPGLVGTLSATAAMSRLRGFDQDRTARALGNAVIGPVTPFIAFSAGAGVKDLYGGWPAGMGLLCAALTDTGIHGPTDLLEGPMGWLQAVGGDPEHPALSLDDPADWVIGQTYVKPHAACSLSHTSIDAAIAIRHRGRPVADIEQVVVRTHVFADRLTNITPASTQAAKFSIPWVVAAALIDGEVFIEQSAPAALDDPRRRELTAKVTVTGDEEFSAAHLADERRRPAHLEITYRDGSREVAFCEYPSGGPENPLTAAAFRQRFDRLTQPVLGHEGAEHLWSSLRALPTVHHPVPGFMEALRLT